MNGIARSRSPRTYACPSSSSMSSSAASRAKAAILRISARRSSRGAHRRAEPRDGELARVGAREGDIGVVALVESHGYVHVVGRHAEDVGHHLGRGGLVALSLRRRAEVDVDLAVEVELHVGRLAVAGEREARVDDARLAEVVGAGVERGADPDPDPLARSPPELLLAPPPGRVVDRLQRHVERLREVPRVVDAAVRRLVGVVLGLDVVLLSQLDRIEPELVGHEVDDPLRQPQVLQARVAAVRAPSGTCS